MSAMLYKHGSEGGYQAELRTKSVCTRCRNAHREYNRQYTKEGRRTGLIYKRPDVIDHLARPPHQGSNFEKNRARRSTVEMPQGPSLTDATRGPESDAAGPEAPSDTTGGPSLSDRIRSLWVPPDDAPANGYVSDTETPDNLRPIDPDPEPMGSTDQWEPDDGEFVINEAGMKKIEDNLGFYLSVVGLTIEMIDPYCGPILSANFDNIVSRWAKVIAHYPSAAKLFLDSKGGILFGWIGAIQATWPVLYALYEHHLAKTVRVQKNGTIERKIDGPNPFRGFDATTPPMEDKFSYTVN